MLYCLETQQIFDEYLFIAMYGIVEKIWSVIIYF